MVEMLGENEQIDDLQLKGLRIIQDKGKFRFGTDAVLLSTYAKIKPGAVCIDLGTGTGILPILLSAKTRAAHITGLEIQPGQYDIALRNVKMNNLDDKVTMVSGDIRQVKKIFTAGEFDNAVSNPPYMKKGSGIENSDMEIAAARHEILCDIDDVAAAAAYLLKDKGMLSMVHRPNRLADIIYALRKNRMEPKTMRLVFPYAGSPPNLVLINAQKNSGCFLKVEKPLIIRNDDGSYTDEIYEIYGMDGI